MNELDNDNIIQVILDSFWDKVWHCKLKSSPFKTRGICKARHFNLSSHTRIDKTRQEILIFLPADLKLLFLTPASLQMKKSAEKSLLLRSGHSFYIKFRFINRFKIKRPKQPSFLMGLVKPYRVSNYLRKDFRLPPETDGMLLPFNAFKKSLSKKAHNNRVIACSWPLPHSLILFQLPSNRIQKTRKEVQKERFNDVIPCEHFSGKPLHIKYQLVDLPFPIKTSWDEGPLINLESL